MQGPPAEPLGSRPGPVVGEILNFLELSSLLCKMGKVTAPTPVPSPRTAEQGEALRPNFLGSNPGASSYQLCSLGEATELL